MFVHTFGLAVQNFGKITFGMVHLGYKVIFQFKPASVVEPLDAKQATVDKVANKSD